MKKEFRQAEFAVTFYFHKEFTDKSIDKLATKMMDRSYGLLDYLKDKKVALLLGPRSEVYTILRIFSKIEVHMVKIHERMLRRGLPSFRIKVDIVRIAVESSHVSPDKRRFPGDIHWIENVRYLIIE